VVIQVSVTASHRASSLPIAAVGTIPVRDSPPQLVIPTVSRAVFVMQLFKITNISEKELF